MKEDDAVFLSCVCAFVLIAIAVTTIYIYYFVDCKNINIISLIISIIFFFFFVILNCMMTLDYYIVTESLVIPGEWVKTIISNYYSYFNRVNSIMTSIILPFVINCLETGYNSKCYIILESIHRIGHSLWKKLKQSLWKALLIIGIVLAIAIVILYYMFKDKYKLKDPLYYFDYFAMALNIKQLIEIYINVGFFISQLPFEFKIEGCCKCIICFCQCCQGNIILLKKYYFYSIRMIVNKIEKYIKKIQEANKAIDEVLKNYNNEINSAFHKFLLGKIKLIKSDLELYKYEDKPNYNNINIPVVYQGNYINLNFSNTVDAINNVNKINDKVETKSLKNKKEEEQKPKIEAKDSEKESEKILAEHIRKYKKATRKIKKLKKLINDITEEYRDECNYQPTHSNKICNKIFHNFKVSVFIAALIIIVVTDFLLPLILYTDSNKISNITNITNITDLISDTIVISEDVLTDTISNDTTTSTNINAGGIIIMSLIFAIVIFIVVVVTSSYTIILLFSVNRRSYISGDFLSGKKINDSISLMKTIKEICGYSFSLVYCNYYIWKYIEEHQLLFYENIYIPDYELKHGFGLYMAAKIVVIILSTIIFRCCGSCGSFLKNDMDDFTKNLNDENYNAIQDEIDFNYFIQYNKIYHVLVS